MAYRPMKYQYETSPRKLKPEYEPIKNDDVKKKSLSLCDEICSRDEGAFLCT